MKLNNYGFIDISYLIWLLVCALILPALYTCFLQLSFFCTTQLDSFLNESELLSVATFMYQDSVGSTLELNNSSITFKNTVSPINYTVTNSTLKRRINRTQNLTQYLTVNSLEMSSSDCVLLTYNNTFTQELCAPLF